MDVLEVLKKNNVGYKIEDAHYRIGSKLHITHFYYAKRFFQNSFFSSKIAFLLAKEITEKIHQHTNKADIILRGITLIGYGIYSELLINLIERFLEKNLGLQNAINHNIIDDALEINLLKKEEEIKKYIIVIVPIASTFSTSVKIEQFLKTLTKFKLQKCEVLSPHYNVLHITDNSIDDKVKELKREFGWQNERPEVGEIDVCVFNDNDGKPKTQKYYLQLQTNWSKVEECSDCFPQNEAVEIPLLEKALYETDSSNVTPNVIFDFPRGRKPLDDKHCSNSFELSTNVIKYGHHIRNNDHFFYSINTELFLKENNNIKSKDSIENWLINIVKKDIKDDISEDDTVLIIACCHYSNAALISLVYEKVFSSAANIIHYDPETDYLQNFAVLYKKDILKANKIIFVDDSLKSGKAFFRIRDFVHYVFENNKINEENVQSSNKIFACIFLVNKSQQFTNELVKANIEKDIYAFASLNLSSTYTQDNKVVILGEQSRFKEVLQTCDLTSLQNHFINYIKKFSTNESGVIPQETREEHLLIIESIHRLYQIFFEEDIVNNFEELNFTNFLKLLLEKTNCPFTSTHSSRVGILNISGFGIATLKVLTIPPFLQFQPLRKKVFNWILFFLDSHITEVVNSINVDKFELNHFKGLCFLLRRASFLRSNYLISSKLLNCLCLLYDEKGIPKLIAGCIKQQKIVGMYGEEIVNEIQKLKGFPIFYTAQVKELFYLNEASALKLEKRINIVLQNSQKIPSGFMHLVRILLLENTLPIKKFVTFIKQQNSFWNKVNLFRSTTDKIFVPNITIERIKKILNELPISSYVRHKNLNTYFEASTQNSSSDNLVFLVYLHIISFIEFYAEDVELLLVDKTSYILSQIKHLMIQPYAKSDIDQIKHFGSFLIVNDNSNNSFIVHDESENGTHALETEVWKDPENNMLTLFLTGQANSPESYKRTIIELKKDTDQNKWINLYPSIEGEDEIKLRPDLLPHNINRLILLRLSKWEITDDKFTIENTLGVLGIYFTSPSPVFTSINRIRYLLLLKEPLANFIEKHHQNNEFRDYLLTENSKRLIMLSGHGKDMLRRLSNLNDPDGIFKKIVLKLEHIQTLIMLNQSQKNIGGGTDAIELELEKVFSFNSGETITAQSYIPKIRNLAKTIFETSEIDTKDTGNVNVNQNNFTSFKFNEAVLNIILFELLLNAKKNRWHFINNLNGDNTGEEVITDAKMPNKIYKANEVNIELRINDLIIPRELTIEITNTGPTINKDHLMNLNNQHNNIKPRDLTAGTSLVKLLIYKILKGKIYFEQDEVCSENHFSIFKVTIGNLQENS